jgi:hypothetical protein
MPSVETISSSLMRFAVVEFCHRDSYDKLSLSCEDAAWNRQPDFLCGFQVDEQLEFVSYSTETSAGFPPFPILPR